MPPKLTPYYQTDMLNGYVVKRSYLAQGHSFFSKLSHFSNRLACKLRLPMSLSTRRGPSLSSFCDHVGSVVFFGPRKQVARPNTGRIVAFVKHAERCVSKFHNKRHPVRSEHTMPDPANLPVAFSIQTSRPNPTRAKFWSVTWDGAILINFIPKPIFNRDTVCGVTAICGAIFCTASVYFSTFCQELLVTILANAKDFCSLFSHTITFFDCCRALGRSNVAGAISFMLAIFGGLSI